jgi:predicted GNAT superfamily acetyltransferase
VTIHVRLLEKAAEMGLVEELQRAVWPESETDIVPLHMLVTVARNGGIVLGAFDEDLLVGFAYGFPGIRKTDTGLQIKHCSHQLGVHPEYRNRGLGFLLKRAQWQMVRHQGVDLITWTYDPLESRNAQLNIHKLGAVSRVYEREFYGDMRDGLNAGLASDRLLVELWVLSVRVDTRLGAAPRRQLDLSQFYSAGARLLNPTTVGPDGFPLPPDLADPLPRTSADLEPLLLMEIPSDFQHLKRTDRGLAVQWRMQTRQLFEALFEVGYMVTDFVHTPGEHPRSFYVFSYGESTLGG